MLYPSVMVSMVPETANWPLNYYTRRSIRPDTWHSGEEEIVFQEEKQLLLLELKIDTKSVST